MSYDAWHDTVQTMMDRGASGTDQQFEDIMDYLHRTMTTINVNTADADELQIVLNVPETAAQAIIARREHAEIQRPGRPEVRSRCRCVDHRLEGPVDFLQMNPHGREEG